MVFGKVGGVGRKTKQSNPVLMILNFSIIWFIAVQFRMGKRHET